MSAEPPQSMEFSESERALILSLTGGRIDLQEFLRSFGRSIAADDRFVLHALRRIVTAKDNESLPYLLYLKGFLPEPVDEALLDVLRPLLSESWHNQHEWIVDMLRAARDARSLPYLCAAAEADYPQLDELDQTSLRNRCVYAIKAIHADDSVRCLRELANRNTETATLAATLLKTMS